MFVLVIFVNLLIYDVIFICIGLSDDILGGKFIFMVEMVEVNDVFIYVIENFFILFDEIGWGIVIYDGFVFV